MYDKAFFEWELELKKAQAEKRSPDFSLRPKEPVRKLLTLSPNVSKSMLISALEESGKLGCCINATELDMVSGAIRNDYGKHDDVFRAAFQHEVVSADFKVNGRQVVAHNPHLAFHSFVGERFVQPFPGVYGPERLVLAFGCPAGGR